MFDMKYLQKVEEYMRSGDLAQDFEYSPEERRHEMLDFLELLMDLGELADEIASKIIFKDSYLGMLAGVDNEGSSPQK